MLEIEKKEIKKQKIFKNDYSRWTRDHVESEQAEQEQFK